MRKQIVSFIALTAIAALPLQAAFAHCQVPCGIYGDETRFTLMEEHITTIEKSMTQIKELSGAAQDNVNQLVRWVNNKETHADEFTEIVTYYFLAQRIKADAPQYEEKLKLLHGLMVSAMKAKQSTDLQNVQDLRDGLKAFEAIYLDKAAAAHLEEHHDGHADGAQAALASAEAGCAKCSYKLTGAKGCETAVKVAGKVYMLKGVEVSAHAVGLCSAVRPIELAGKVDGADYLATTLNFTDKK